MVDVIDTSMNIQITITPEGIASISCSNCTGQVVYGTDYTLTYTLTNNGAASDTLFAEIWSQPGPTYGVKELTAFSGMVAAGATTVPQSVIFQNVTGTVSKSIRVGHIMI